MNPEALRACAGLFYLCSRRVFRRRHGRHRRPATPQIQSPGSQIQNSPTLSHRATPPPLRARFRGLPPPAPHPLCRGRRGPQGPPSRRRPAPGRAPALTRGLRIRLRRPARAPLPQPCPQVLRLRPLRPGRQLSRRCQGPQGRPPSARCAAPRSRRACPAPAAVLLRPRRARPPQPPRRRTPRVLGHAGRHRIPRYLGAPLRQRLRGRVRLRLLV
ncbi:hypothetical protein BH11PLA1_BH11PLA1_15450 [soil metagenome]